MTKEIDSEDPVAGFNNETGMDVMNDISLFEKYLDKEFEASVNYSKVMTMKPALETSQHEFYAKYKFLRKVVKPDPGTAGGECEDVFATFLRKYLPKTLEVIVGGLIILENGTMSPQIDIIITQDLPESFCRSYILHEYVVAAFEVKLTFETRYLKKITDTAALLRPFAREGTPREVLFGRIIYGVLALSSNMSGSKLPTDEKTLGENEKEFKALEKALRNIEKPAHPSQAIDLFLVADAFCLGASKTVNYSEKFPNDFPDVDLSYFYNLASGSGKATASNLARMIAKPPRDQHLGAFLYRLFLMLYREGVIPSRSPEAFFPFDSNIAFGCYSWNIDVLGEQFKDQWNAKSEDTSLEWQSMHPF